MEMKKLTTEEERNEEEEVKTSEPMLDAKTEGKRNVFKSRNTS